MMLTLSNDGVFCQLHHCPPWCCTSKVSDGWWLPWKWHRQLLANEPLSHFVAVTSKWNSSILFLCGGFCSFHNLVWQKKILQRSNIIAHYYTHPIFCPAEIFLKTFLLQVSDLIPRPVYCHVNGVLSCHYHDNPGRSPDCSDFYLSQEGVGGM